MAGFNRDDFSFLSDAERDRLSGSVARFLEAVRHVPPVASVSREQIAQAEAPFLEIVELLAFDRYEDPDAFRIGKLVEARIEEQRPLWLVELRFKTGFDSTEEPALWILAYLADDQWGGEESFERKDFIRRLLAEAAAEADAVRYPFVSFRKESDLQSHAHAAGE